VVGTGLEKSSRKLSVLAGQQLHPTCCLSAIADLFFFWMLHTEPGGGARHTVAGL